MKVSLIGIGVMGSAIGHRLLDVKADLTVFNRSVDKTRPLAERGATVAASAGEAAANTDFVVLCLNTADIVEAAVFGAGGVAESATQETLLVDMSSIDAGRTVDMAERLLQQTGTGWVDAPLSGGAPAVNEGRLTLMLGGSTADIERAEPLLRELSNNYTAMGGSGAGQTVKLINQVLCAAGFMAVAEAVRFAEAHDVDASRIPAALAGGRADSAILQEFMAKMAARDYTPTGRIGNMLKDLETIQSAALEKRVPMPVSSVITDLHRMLVAGGYEAADIAEYMRLFDMARDR